MGLSTQTPSVDDGTKRWTEVRLLGALRVRLPDGSHVADRDWKTGKNVDLLRWLALHTEAPVPVEVLAEGLWPDSPVDRARSSLRTAVAQLRRLLGPETVGRVGEALSLTSCWVDATTFVQLADDAERYRRAGRHAEAYTAALEADALFLGDPPVGEGAPGPLAERVATLVTLHRRLLGDAAEAAAELRWWRDAEALAQRVLDTDPLAERASRVLMLAQAALGETSRALQEYERLRHALAEELGVDPSPQTRAAHLRVLQPAPTPDAHPPVVGRDAEVAWLRATLAAPTGPVVLRGPDGSGRRRLVAEAAGGRPVVSGRPGVPAPAGDGDVVLVWEPDVGQDLGLVRRALAGDGAATDRTTVLLLPPARSSPTVDELVTGHTARTLDLAPLLPEELDTLARHVLTGTPLPSLVEQLHAGSGGLPGPALALLREWSGTGQLVATSRGLALAARVPGQEQDRSGRRALERALPSLDGDTLEALQVAALLDQAVTPVLLAPLLADLGVDGGDDDVRLRARATAALEQLVDLALMRSSPAGTVWRHPMLQDAVRAWMRPAVAQRLHRRIAGKGAVSGAARVRHWLEAGERELACVAALDAADDCSARGDHAGARSHLLEVLSLGDLPEAAAADRAELYEGLGDACLHLNRAEEARAAYAQALEVSLQAMLPQAARLRRKLERAADARTLGARAPTGGDGSSALNGFGALVRGGTDPPGGSQLEAYLQDAVEQADRRRDARRRVEARLQVAAAVCLPRRDFRGVHRWVQEALAHEASAGDRLRGVLVRSITPVLLGGGATVVEELEAASRTAEAGQHDELWWRLLGMRVLVAHDLGLPTFDPLWRRLADRVTSGAVDDLVPELAAIGLRVLAEREDLDRAATMASHLALAGGRVSPVLEHLSRLASAELSEALGDSRHAASLLHSAVAEGVTSGSTLLVPEAAARLAWLEALHDRPAARTAFDTYDDVVGAMVGGPREEFWARLSRAALRAGREDLAGAAKAADQAGALATHHGLQVLAARARRVRADYLRAAAEAPPRAPRSAGAQEPGSEQRLG